ncbi:hypothetical protein FB563_4443 [Streptomyces puniciscabiei]|uniref:Uncharacterized protein n=1 Tax=Streptomyces puniciscabiei TaxID=164348 RepID=A0A542UJY2_9ACTN|nr:hypothetical protein FB563_4443 [Streptomyces puniciscabiei]
MRPEGVLRSISWPRGAAGRRMTRTRMRRSMTPPSCRSGPAVDAGRRWVPMTRPVQACTGQAAGRTAVGEQGGLDVTGWRNGRGHGEPATWCSEPSEVCRRFDDDQCLSARGEFRAAGSRGSRASATSARQAECTAAQRSVTPSAAGRGTPALTSARGAPTARGDQGQPGRWSAAPTPRRPPRHDHRHRPRPGGRRRGGSEVDQGASRRQRPGVVRVGSVDDRYPAERRAAAGRRREGASTPWTSRVRRASPACPLDLGLNA